MNHPKIKILMAQINPTVGAISDNLKKITKIIEQHHQHYDLIVFPELAICGYPPEDLLLHTDFIDEIDLAIQYIASLQVNCRLLLGCARQSNAFRYNSVAYIYSGNIQYYDKQALPNYGIFDEKRYFTSGSLPVISFEIHGHRFGVLICEDIWVSEISNQIHERNIQTLISINASPYEQHKHFQRLKIIRNFSREQINVLYLNLVGGQDELVFDGRSLAMNSQGQVCVQAVGFQESMIEVDIENNKIFGAIAPALEPSAELYEALRCGLKDFIQKNRFKKVVLGLSGGIDSAVTLALAVDAIGANNVHVLLMPSPYTAQMSIDDAIAEAKILGVSYEIIPIHNLIQQFHHQFKYPLEHITQQNLQARIRGMLLMTYSNQNQALLLSTSNKSEAAVGYCTLYGDMCGGYAVLKDVYKMEVYALARQINRFKDIIPPRVIERAPSAELAPHQTDQDDLPPYPILDELLKDIIENRLPEAELLKKGYSIDMVQKIYKKIKSSEFKRFQCAPGTKISSTAFGRDWRLPITHHWKL